MCLICLCTRSSHTYIKTARDWKGMKGKNGPLVDREGSKSTMRIPSSIIYLVMCWSSLPVTATVRRPVHRACVESPRHPGWRRECTLLRVHTPGGLGGAYCFPFIVFSFCLPVPSMLPWLVVLIETVGYLKDIYLLIWLFHGCRNGLWSRDTNIAILDSCESPKNELVGWKFRGHRESQSS